MKKNGAPTVTIREFLNTRKKRAFLFFLTGGILFMGGLFLAAALNTSPDLAGLGFIIAFGGIAFNLTGAVCPACKNSLAFLLSARGGPFRIAPEAKSCPYCGTDLDTEVPQRLP